MTTKGSTAQAARFVLRVAGDLNFRRADELKNALVAALDAGTAVDIDLADVAEVDSAGVQLLIAARKDAANAAKDLRFVAHSPSLLATIELLGLESCIGATTHFADADVQRAGT